MSDFNPEAISQEMDEAYLRTPWGPQVLEAVESGELLSSDKPLEEMSSDELFAWVQEQPKDDTYIASVEKLVEMTRKRMRLGSGALGDYEYHAIVALNTVAMRYAHHKGQRTWEQCTIV